MTGNVVIKMRILEELDGETREQTYEYAACQYIKDGCIYLQYKEQIEGTKEEVQTMLKLDEETMTIQRKGPIVSKMPFANGQTTQCSYYTSVGPLYLTMDTKKYIAVLQENALQVFLEYDLFINERPAGHHIISFTV